MGARWSFFSRTAVVVLPIVSSTFSLSHSRPEPRGVGIPEAESDTIDCRKHEVSTRETPAGLMCTVRQGRHFVCPSCGHDLGTEPGSSCSSCARGGA